LTEQKKRPTCSPAQSDSHQEGARAGLQVSGTETASGHAIAIAEKQAHPIASLRILEARTDGFVVDEEIASCNVRDYAGYTEMMRLLHGNDAGLPRMCARPSSYMVACPGIAANPKSSVMSDSMKP